ncbi:magnesium-translocating P-type ATPase [Enterococcus viikkiensis]|uniref:Magnesium-transporting ATPase, P-type 1 n=1 Tax=Enterococcus viikkiensis TaxID=930854 RepID=A0ABU3FSA6_9ENTE|nr:magnesium-translocating P-type ATPase [Enterococcus viikkiensis]MDT2828159.1 magnesium-translocating P-type ATPase [Enterococcus viikkiensis]
MNKKNLLARKNNKDQELKKLAILSDRDLFLNLRTSLQGLSEEDAQSRLEEYGPNEVSAQKPTPAILLFLQAFNDPFVYVLALLAIVSLLTSDFEAAIVMTIMILASVLITFIQEYRSQKASIELKEMIENTAAITRNGETKEIPMDEIVPGDILTLATGDMIPADAVLIWTKDLFVNQSSLTGESMPVEKFVPKEAAITEEMTALDLTNLVFMGTDVLSGQGKAIILKTGQQTFFGDIAKNATSKRGKTSFDIGLNRVSKLLLRMVMVLFPLVFLINGLTKGDWSSAFFFAIAVAVGLTPEMLPMIVSSNLAKGALTLSKHKVIVKELASIQNLGSMDVLCTDKTGTITEDRVVLVQHLDPLGNENEQVLDYAFMNSTYQTGWKNLMDIAVINYFEEQDRQLPFQSIQKIDEIPFDFSRRRLTVVMKTDQHQLMITKGAVEEMAAICKYVEINGETLTLTSEIRQQLQAVNEKMNRQGMRVITVAVRRDAHEEAIYSTDDEKEMTLIGFMGFLDPAKASAKPAINSLQQHGVAVKVLTGDNAIVAQKVCQDVGIPAKNYVLGNQVDEMSEEELYQAAETTNLFAKLNPMQKSRIIEALQSKGHTVGFMGDGINDAPALRKADVGISVDTAADITKDASSIILLEKSLSVLEYGVIEGRRVFSNMMKYIKITISSNFGNVFSILVASAFLPFLPMLSLQLLLQNLIYDIAQLTIPWDNVDEEELHAPTKWETKGLLKFTLCIGPISSIFDIVTFFVMWFVFGATTVAQQNLFQTGWFMVGLTTQALVVLMVRTRKIPFLQSRPAPQVFISLLLAVVVGVLVVVTPIAEQFDFVHLPTAYWFWYIGIVVVYMLATQFGKVLYIKVAKEWI